MNRIEYDNIIAFHPGYYLKDMLEAWNMTQDEFAKRLDTSGKTVSKLLNGKINLTEEMALSIATVFGTSVTLWLNLNKNFIEKKLEIEKRKRENRQAEVAEKLDYNFFLNLGVVDAVCTPEEKVCELQKFLHVANLATLERNDFLVQTRDSEVLLDTDYFRNANAWVQTALSIEDKTEVEKFSMKKIKKALPEIRRMTGKSPEEVYPRLKRTLADCGIAFVMLPKLGECDICGAVKWDSREKVIMAVNEKSEYRDQFWYTIFHELGNVLEKKVAMLLVSDEEQKLADASDLRREVNEKANQFACDMMISHDKFEAFLEKNQFDKESITAFAKKAGIDPGIVVGQLQRKRILSYHTGLNVLRQKME